MHLSFEQLKIESEKLRAEHALAGNPIRHCHSLEIVAKRHGFANWRSARATLAELGAEHSAKTGTTAATAAVALPGESERVEQPARPITSKEFDLAFRIHTLRSQVAREEQRVAAASNPTGAQLARLEDALLEAENTLASTEAEHALDQVTEGIARSAQASRDFARTKVLPDRYLTHVSGIVADYVCLWVRTAHGSPHFQWTLDRYGRWAEWGNEGYDHDNDSTKADYSARREAARLGVPILSGNRVKPVTRNPM